MLGYSIINVSFVHNTMAYLHIFFFYILALRINTIHKHSEHSFKSSDNGWCVYCEGEGKMYINFGAMVKILL